MRDIALELRRQRACTVHAVAGSEEQKRFFTSEAQRDAYDSVSVQGYPIRAIEETLPPTDQLLERARHYEAKTGVTYNRLAVGDRHFGKGYALLGSGHPRSRYSENSEYSHLLHGYNQYFEFW